MVQEIQCRRLKQFREELNLTQTEFAQTLGIGKTTTEYERGRTKFSGELVWRLYSLYQLNPKWLYGESDHKYLKDETSKERVPAVITIENSGFENILMVNNKAAAGYTGNLNNQEYYEQLPAFSFPIPEYRNATFRCFQVEGQSMMPAILPGEWIITKAVENLHQIKNNNIYVIVDTDGIRVKQVHNEPTKNALILLSINQDYPQVTLRYDKVLEIWAFHSKITKELMVDSTQYKLDTIYNDIKLLKAKIIE